MTENQTSLRTRREIYDAKSSVLEEFADLFVPSGSVRAIYNYSGDVRVPIAADLAGRVDWENNLNTRFLPSLYEIGLEKPTVFLRGPSVKTVPSNNTKRVNIQQTGRIPLMTNDLFTLAPPLTAGFSDSPPLQLDTGGDGIGFISVYPLETVEYYSFKKEMNQLLSAVQTMATAVLAVKDHPGVEESFAFKGAMASVFFPVLRGNTIWKSMHTAIGKSTGYENNDTEKMGLLLKYFKNHWWPHMQTDIGHMTHYVDVAPPLISNGMILSEIQKSLAVLDESAVLKGFEDFAEIVTNNSDPSTTEVKDQRKTMEKLLESQNQGDNMVTQLTTRIRMFEPKAFGHICRAPQTPILRGMRMDVTLF